VSKRRRKNRPNAKGRNPYSRFVRLPHSLLETSAYRTLSLAARAVLTELAMLENGSNNGELFLSVRDAADRIGVVDLGVVRKALDDLVERGFIKVSQEAHFHIKAAEKSRARCWQLTWIPAFGKAPTRDFDRVSAPVDPKACKRMTSGIDAIIRFKKRKKEGQFAVLDSNTTI